MEAYKEINKALIIHNQDLKMQNGILQKEIILLRHELMDEHAKRVICEKKFKRILIENFRTAMAKIDPENALLELLGNDDDNAESSASLREVRARTLRKPQSSEILRELRRSMLLQRRSSIVASPTRRSSSAMSIESEFNETRNRSMTAIQSNFDSVERSPPGDNSIASVNNSDGENVTQEEDEEDEKEYDGNGNDDNSEEIQEEDQVVENEATPRNMHNLSYIWEEEKLQGDEDDDVPLREDDSDGDGSDDDNLSLKDEENNIQEDEVGESNIQEDEVGESNIQEDEVEENNIQEDEVKKLQNKDKLQKRDEVTINTSKQHSRKKQKLEQSPTLVQPIKKSRRNASTLLRSPLKDISNLANDDEKQKSHTKTRNLQVVVRRGKRRSIVSDENIIQTVRDMANQQTEKHGGLDDEPFSIANNAIRDRDPSLESAVASIGFSEELTIGQFAEALSSTPNNNTTTNNTNTREEETKYSEQSTRTCAKRSCRPKCLIEPSLIRKLRNESTDKSRTSRKKK